jgi:diguanylate cyclase (GGDEF)-like protein
MNKYLHDKQKLIILIAILLGIGFLTTSLASYYVSKSAIRDSIVANELPVTADNVYSEIQKDLVRPIFVSSMMASDTFLRDWILDNEKDTSRITKYLKEIKQRYHAVASFFVSERSRNYYYADGILKKVKDSERRDDWYFRVRKLEQPYEINVDPDLANRDAMTIFINHRVFDYEGNFIGVTGVGLTVDSVKRMVNEYQQRYRRNVYFVDRGGKIVLSDGYAKKTGTDIRSIEGLETLADGILKSGYGSFVYQSDGETQLLNVRFISELNWFLFVEKTESEATAGIRRTLYLNVLLCLLVTAVVLFAATVTINRFQSRLEEMATKDKLTGLFNRQAFDILMGQFQAEQKRREEPFCVILFDIDHFKQINDSYGHLEGDLVLSEISRVAASRLRESDILCRWGGEEFLAILKGCVMDDAFRMAEEIRMAVSQLDIQSRTGKILVTISLGVAQYVSGEKIDQLLRRVDQAMYLAKERGRNRTSTADADS